MKKYLYLSALFFATAGLAACGGSSSSSTTTTSKTGLSLPTEISAVPTTASNTTKVGLKSKLSALRAATDADTDYSNASTTTFVNEHTLEQFAIIEQVLGALGQTHYADASNVGQGAYKAMVAWQDEQNGVETKSLQPWIVQSDIIVENGAEVTRARAWIEEVEEGQKEVIKAEFKIYEAATQDSSGAYTSYGVWTLNVKFGDEGTDFFAASAEVGSNGESIIKLHERFPEGEGFVFEVKAILNKSATSGFGKVSFPDWDSCTEHPCMPTAVEAKYAYNANHLAVQKAGESEPTFKDRADITEMTHRYGLFDSTTGDNLFKTKSFGFPVFFTDDNGFRQYAYYGAWQGRHELWGGGESGVASGTVVTRDDHGGSETAATYTVSPSFQGTLTKRSLVAGALGDILDIPVETWINKHYDLFHDGTNWTYCTGWIDFGQSPPACMNHDGSSGSFVNFTDFNSLVVGEQDRKFVGIGRWDQSQNQQKDYVYLSADPGLTGYTTAGFYEAQHGMEGLSPISPAERLTETSGTQLWVDIGGSIYIQYTGEFSGPTTTTGWVQKTLENFDQRTWTPEFATNGDSAFTPAPGQEYYINSNGANFVVRRKDNSGTISANSYEVMVELQKTANPNNFSSMLPTGTDYLRTPWRQEVRYTFVTTTGSNFLTLQYLSDDSNTQDVDESVTPTVVTSGEWGLQAYDDNGTPSDFTDDMPLQSDGTGVTVDEWGNSSDPDIRPVQFNWEYSENGGWGNQKFLIDGDGNYVLLSDPVQLQAVTLTNNGGDSKTLSLQYDGWMHGLPNLFEDLRKNDFVMNATISDKIINIPAGTEVTDAVDTTKSYLIKPLEVSQFLNPVSDPGGLDITVADSVDLSSVPDFVEHGMGDIPTVTVTKYSEGILIE